ncbi:hypothetical protein K440DRAFT_308470 [Wilcoxina mikolae CBS 423.85]|nr:hypothetical protein K440DRAFT_308470 [Wilcoxina mikolae CBS 423.85]
MYAWFGTYLRQAHHFPLEEGKLQGSRYGCFTRIKLTARAEAFNDITIDSLPRATPKPENPRRSAKHRPKSILEIHEGFTAHPLRVRD